MKLEKQVEAMIKRSRFYEPNTTNKDLRINAIEYLIETIEEYIDLMQRRAKFNQHDTHRFEIISNGLKRFQERRTKAVKYLFYIKKN